MPSIKWMSFGTLVPVFSLQWKTVVNFFATPRPTPDTEKNFTVYISQHISALEGDIRNYLNSHINQLLDFVLESTDLQDKIKSKIIEAVD
jgi:hypothetical protein